MQFFVDGAQRKFNREDDDHERERTASMMKITLGVRGSFRRGGRQDGC
jgi:hypothetical protein